MSKYKVNRINWIDLETTGLDPEKDVILEMALVITDGDLNELACGSWLIEQPDARFQPGAYEMHKASGLLDSTAPKETATSVSFYMSRAMSDYGSKGAPLGGNSPQFDRRFIRHHMPMLNLELSHRHFDTSTLLQAAHTWGLDLPDPEPEHRAMSDIRRSIEIARRFKGLVTP